MTKVEQFEKAWWIAVKENDFVLADEIYHPEYSAFDNNAGVEVNLGADKKAVSTIREMLVAGTGKTTIRNQVLSRRNRWSPKSWSNVY